VNVLPVGDIQNYLDVGNVLNLDLNKAGFNDDGTRGVKTLVKILGMGDKPMEGTVPLILNKYTSEIA